MNSRITADLARRLREVREEIYGTNGGWLLAESLGLPHRSWTNYEAGVTIPGHTILLFVALTGANPAWLLTGDGPRYRHAISRDDSPAPIIGRPEGGRDPSPPDIADGSRPPSRSL